MSHRKKLIEVAMPLGVINQSAGKEKSIRNHPGTIHLWWSRKPLGACRSVLFSSLVTDPFEYVGDDLTESEALMMRERLLNIAGQLAHWESTTNKEVLHSAKKEIARSIAYDNTTLKGIDRQTLMRVKTATANEEEIARFLERFAPTVVDPFCGAGSIPLEGQRLGLRTIGFDLNPMAVAISKATVELPSLFHEVESVNPGSQDQILQTGPCSGLASDIRYYGRKLYELVLADVGELFPQFTDSGEQILAWLSARSVTCPNPSCRAPIPLATKWWLAKKKNTHVWLSPEERESTFIFHIEAGFPDPIVSEINSNGSCFVNEKGKKTKATFQCLKCQSGVVNGAYINTEATEGRLMSMPLAKVSKASRGRNYHCYDATTAGDIDDAATEFLKNTDMNSLIPEEACRGTFASNAQGRRYGFESFSDYYTKRQLAFLVSCVTNLDKVAVQIKEDAAASNFSSSHDDELALAEGGRGARAYADAIRVYISLAIDRLAMTGNSLVRWNPVGEKCQHSFGMQAIPMVWDFAEPNPFANATGGLMPAIELVSKPLEFLGGTKAKVQQNDAAARIPDISNILLSTDPPYYDNVSYADLSDFFYVWLRRCLIDVYPSEFGTLLTPKSNELLMAPHRFDGDKDKAEKFFEEGLLRAFKNITQSTSDFPVTIFYAFKQSELKEAKGERILISTGWEKMLSALLRSGLQITGTWPLRTEMSTRQVAMDTNALATSICLVCRPRPETATQVTRRDFSNALRKELPEAIKHLQSGNVAPVDLAQASIGPGMAVFSRYSKVVNADGSPMSVREALQLINQVLDESLVEQESDFDSETRFALRWFEQYGLKEGPFGDAETLAKAMAVAVNSIVDSGVARSGAGKVRLLKRDELQDDWDPQTDDRSNIWEATLYLAKALESGGESKAAGLIARLGAATSETARELAYRLYQTCERAGDAKEAGAYNSLVVSWPEILRLSQESEQLTDQNELNI